MCAAASSCHFWSARRASDAAGHYARTQCASIELLPLPWPRRIHIPHRPWSHPAPPLVFCRIVTTDPQPFDRFGVSIALQGNTLIVGAQSKLLAKGLRSSKVVKTITTAGSGVLTGSWEVWRAIWNCVYDVR